MRCSDGKNALMYATPHDHAPIMHWLVKEGGARISDADIEEGKTALIIAIAYGRYFLAQWLLEEGGANITDRVAQVDGEHRSLWEQLKVHLTLNPYKGGTRLLSLLKVVELLDDAPPGFIPELSPMSF
jgi:hypothetical protein